jgi:hypothetical protein
MQGAVARRFELQQTSAATSFYTALAGKKLVRFQEFAALYPEAVFVFVGDNGQVTKPSSLAKRSRLQSCLWPSYPVIADPAEQQAVLVLTRHRAASGVRAPSPCLQLQSSGW